MHGEKRAEPGTRFRLFVRPPYAHPDWPADVVSIAAPPGSIGPGPSDNRLYVIEPIGKSYPYGVNAGPFGTPHLDLPPWRGSIRIAAQPGWDGHFDHIALDTPEFAQAHIFGTIRYVLEIWERYYGRRIEWHFARHFERLEVAIVPQLNNATAGYGFMEVGAHRVGEGALLPYALNFDVMAHELGHLIVYSTLGLPDRTTERGEYFGFHESAADMTALIAASHFNSLLDHLLEATHGNLFSFNELDRFAELSATSQIRLASNSVKLSRFAAGWTDEHALSQPLTGALFDILVDVFQENLVERGLIGREVANLADRVGKNPEYSSTIQAMYDAAYTGRYVEFRAALVEARDYLGTALAIAWQRLSPDFFEYSDVASAMLAVDRDLSGGRYRDEISEAFDWREIGRAEVGPRLAQPDEFSHAFSTRTLVPENCRQMPKMSYHERVLVAYRAGR
jgi:hypothetical protein